MARAEGRGWGVGAGLLLVAWLTWGVGDVATAAVTHPLEREMARGERTRGPAAAGHLAGQLIVKLKAGASPEALEALNQQFGVTRVEPLFSRPAVGEPSPFLDQLYLLTAPAAMPIGPMVSAYQQHPSVVYAEPNYTVEVQPSPREMGGAAAGVTVEGEALERRGDAVW